MKTELITNIESICWQPDMKIARRGQMMPLYGRIVMSPLIGDSEQAHWVKVVRPMDNSGIVLGFVLQFDSNMALNQFIESDDIMLVDWVWLYSERSYAFWESICHRVNKSRRDDTLLMA